MRVEASPFAGRCVQQVEMDRETGPSCARRRYRGANSPGMLRMPGVLDRIANYAGVLVPIRRYDNIISVAIRTISARSCASVKSRPRMAASV